jgi:hypothetical protein
MKLYMFRTVRLSIIRSLFTVHSAMVHVILKFHKQVRITCVCVCVRVRVRACMRVRARTHNVVKIFKNIL